MAIALEKPPKSRFGVRVGKRITRIIDHFLARHSTVATTPFLMKDQFPQVTALEENWSAIKKDLELVLQAPGDIPTFHELSPDQVRISKGDNWKTYTFFIFGHRIDENCAACPATARVLDAMPGLQNAWFSILAPGYHIPSHRGPTKAVVRCHLGLEIPSRRKDCWIRVDSEVRHWVPGQCLCFDDTFEHEVKNDTDEQRVVLFLDINRPLDGIGNVVRNGLLTLLRTSAYVRRPLANLRAWNQQVRDRAN